MEYSCWGSIPSHSECECELAKVTVCHFCAGLQGNKELLCGFAGADFILDEQEVLPLQESCQSDVRANRVDSDVHASSRSQIVIRELADDRVRLLECELIQKSKIASRLDGSQ